MITTEVPTWAVGWLVRIEAIEARQRAYGMHDPQCPAFHDCRREGCGVYHAPKACNCWLSEPTT